MKSRNEFLEWKTVHQNLYGTPVMPVHQAIADGKCMILDIDVQGAGEVFRLFPSAVGVFITAPDMIELERRLRLRGSDSEDVIRVRLANAAKELSLASLFTHLIVNDDLDTAAESFVQIVRETCCAENEPGTPERA
jgi:guanylate kinase